MAIARAIAFEVPPHGLFELQDATPCYIVRRFDRVGGGSKLQMEDMAQILGFATEDKYKGSIEKIGSAIWKFATNPGLEVLRFYERLLFAFTIGNGDMHLKNWSLITDKAGVTKLAPCYDFVASTAYIREEEQSALSLSGKKNKLGRQDFDALADKLRLEKRQLTSIYERLAGVETILRERLPHAGLDSERASTIEQIVATRLQALGLR